MPAILEARDLTKRYRLGTTTVDALRGVSLSVAEGEFVALMGPSGSGKTTLLNLIGGLDSPTRGEITVDGSRIDALGSGQLSQWRSHHVGFVFQFYNLMPTLTAQKNVELPLLLTNLNAAQRKRNAEIALELVGLKDRGKHRPSELSGGQQQRVAIARALISRPTVIFADEPTGNLDSTTSAEILELLRQSVSDYGQTTVMVTHDASAAAIADRVLFLADGCIVKELRNAAAHDILSAMEEVSRS
jgi:putative ABC transport system ATP-binding protein